LFKTLTVDLRYDDTAGGEIGDVYGNRVVISGRLAL